MVTLQILVLSFLVRVRVSQQQFEHHPTRVMLFLFIYIPDKVVEITFWRDGIKDGIKKGRLLTKASFPKNQ